MTATTTDDYGARPEIILTQQGKPPPHLTMNEDDTNGKRVQPPCKNKNQCAPTITNSDELSVKNLILIVAYFHFHAATIVAHHLPRLPSVVSK
mmetsp:Transcript_32674/g.69621  ORF Transcript_32674/g.69621 Transcript_32674/m.69621 type:complete len:93 (-) Transcript_32674:1654-1932(-)